MDYQPLIERWQDSELNPWALLLQEQIATGLSLQRYGDLPRWLRVLEDLPDLRAREITLDAARVGASLEQPLPDREQALLRDSLMGLHPWRKGPLTLGDVRIDTEWRSDWKWARLKDAIAPLDGRKVLDVGSGNGYYALEMRKAGAAVVIGVDPTLLFAMQFLAINVFAQDPAVFILPMRLEETPPANKVFDTTFSMGVLYHQREPLDHLRRLQTTLRAGGQLVLETIYLPGDDLRAETPDDRYARMRNVWSLPTVPLLTKWLEETGYVDIEIVDQTVTTTDEQRSTEWMKFESLREALDPDDPAMTVEGWPAPHRAIVTASVN